MGQCRTCGAEVSGCGRRYCKGCQPSVKTGNGYIAVYQPDHPRANKGGYVLEHLLVMEQKMGRFLKDKEVVHHIDGNPQNNIPDNLMLFATTGKHMQHHASLKRREIITDLLSITPAQWGEVWQCNRWGYEAGHSATEEYLRRLGLKDGALRRAMNIAGRGYVKYLVYNQRWGDDNTNPLMEKFRTEFIEYATAQAMKARLNP